MGASLLQEQDPDSSQARRRMTQPLTGLLIFLGGLIGLSFVAFLITAAIGRGTVTFLGFGTGPLCVPASISGPGIQWGPEPLIAGLRPGMTAGVGSTVSVCANHPSARQQMLSFLTHFPETLYALVIVAAVVWLLVIVRRQGPFVPQVVRILRFLGWFILLGDVVAAVVQSLAASYFLATAVTSPVPVGLNAFNSGSTLLVPLVACCALLTLTRIIRTGTRLRDDLAGTV